MSNLPNPRSAIVYIEPYEVALRLSQLGLERDGLVEAAQQGALQRRLCTPLDFHATPGFVAWARSLRELRRHLVELGGHPGDYMRIPVAYNDNETLAVAVASGDEFTGINGDRDPASKPDRGEATQRAVEVNEAVEMFPEETSAPELWYLLIRDDEEGLFAELSSPKSMGAEARVTEWRERIVLGLIDPELVESVRVTPSDHQEIDVPVKRRVS